MATRDNPYGAFNFMVKLGDIGGEDQIVGGFSDVSGLGNEVKFSEYRNGNDAENHVRKIANMNTHRRRHAQARRDRRPAAVRLAQGDPGGRPRPAHGDDHPARRGAGAGLQWMLQSAQPKKWVGPTLAAKGGGEVAMEELHLVAERIDFESVMTARACSSARPACIQFAARRPPPAEPVRSDITGFVGVALRGPGRPAGPGDQLVGVRALVRRGTSAGRRPEPAAAPRRPGILRPGRATGLRRAGGAGPGGHGPPADAATARFDAGPPRAALVLFAADEGSWGDLLDIRLDFRGGAVVPDGRRSTASVAAAVGVARPGPVAAPAPPRMACRSTGRAPRCSTGSTAPGAGAPVAVLDAPAAAAPPDTGAGPGGDRSSSTWSPAPASRRTEQSPCAATSGSPGWGSARPSAVLPACWSATRPCAGRSGSWDAPVLPDLRLTPVAGHRRSPRAGPLRTASTAAASSTTASPTPTRSTSRTRTAASTCWAGSTRSACCASRPDLAVPTPAPESRAHVAPAARCATRARGAASPRPMTRRAAGGARRPRPGRRWPRSSAGSSGWWTSPCSVAGSSPCSTCRSGSRCRRSRAGGRLSTRSYAAAYHPWLGRCRPAPVTRPPCRPAVRVRRRHHRRRESASGCPGDRPTSSRPGPSSRRDVGHRRRPRPAAPAGRQRVPRRAGRVPADRGAHPVRRP